MLKKQCSFIHGVFFEHIKICDHLLTKADFSFEDLYVLSVELHELFESSVTIPKLFLARLKVIILSAFFIPTSFNVDPFGS